MADTGRKCTPDCELSWDEICTEPFSDDGNGCCSNNISSGRCCHFEGCHVRPSVSEPMVSISLDDAEYLYQFLESAELHSMVISREQRVEFSRRFRSLSAAIASTSPQGEKHGN